MKTEPMKRHGGKGNSPFGEIYGVAALNARFGINGGSSWRNRVRSW